MSAEPDGTLSTLVDILRRFPQARLWVIGDVMLDEYLEGDVRRISPEAPVQVLQVRDESHRLGGAANVAHNARALCAEVELCGVVGRDEPGDRVAARCASLGIGTAGLGRVAERPTTHKVRVLARNQQLIRLDWETGEPVDPAAALALFAQLRAGRRPDAIVLSDYAKGLLTAAVVEAVTAFAREAGVPLLVDPKTADFTRYRGATVVKPNLAEVEQASGRKLAEGDDQALEDAARVLLAQAEARALVVTLGSRGLAVVTPEAPLRLLEAERRDVYDVTGAGDTVMAVLALSLAVGADIVSAAQLANVAGGIVVTRVGTAVVRSQELAAALRPHSAAKMLSLEQLVQRRAWWLAQNRKLVLTNGCFDLLHVGHVSLLRQAASHGDALVVAINSDASVRRLKGHGRPVVPEAERARMIAALECVDAVVIFDEDTPLELLRQVRPDVLVKGADYTVDQVVGRELVDSYGGRVVLVPLLPEHSTSALVDKIRGSS